jgi:hypothetical protein
MEIMLHYGNVAELLAGIAYYTSMKVLFLLSFP